MAWLLASPLSTGADAPAAIQPSMELLEYMGLLVELEGELIGPDIFDDEANGTEQEGTNSGEAIEMNEVPDKGKSSHD